MRSALLTTVAAVGLFAGVNLAAAQTAPEPRKEQPTSSQQEQKAPRAQADEKVTPETRKSADDKAAQDKSKAARDKTQPVKGKAAQDQAKPADGKAAQDKTQPAKDKAAQDQAKPAEGKAAQEKATPAADKAAQEKAAPANKAADKAKPAEDRAAQDKAAQDNKAQDNKAPKENTAQDKANPSKSTTASDPARANPASDKAASAASSVAPEKQAKISEVVAKEKVEPVTNINFSISVGTAIPERVRARRLPDEIVTIVPEYRGYDYIVVEEEIVIIEPRTRKIVVTIPRHGSRSAGVSTTVSTGITLTPEKRKLIHDIVLGERVRPVDKQVEVVVGNDLPRTVEVHKFSDRLYSEIPELQSYEFFVRDTNVVLVRDKKIVEIID